LIGTLLEQDLVKDLVESLAKDLVKDLVESLASNITINAKNLVRLGIKIIVVKTIGIDLIV
jgi:hypothetical protein